MVLRAGMFHFGNSLCAPFGSGITFWCRFDPVFELFLIVHMPHPTGITRVHAQSAFSVGGWQGTECESGETADRRPLKSRIASKLVVFFASRPPRALRSMAPNPPFPPLNLHTHSISRGRVQLAAEETRASSRSSRAPQTRRWHSTATPLPWATACLISRAVAEGPGNLSTQALPPWRRRTRISAALTLTSVFVRASVTGHLGWIRLGYGEMTEEFRVPSDHLESLLFCGTSVQKL